MKKPFHQTLVALCLLLLSTLTHGQSTNPLFQHLPQDAGHVYELNFDQINSKGSGAITALLGSIPPGKNAQTGLIFTILKDPGAAGVDLSQNIFFTQTTATGTGTDTLSFMNVLVKLSDSAKFRSTLTHSITGMHLHRLPGKGVTASKEHLGIAWNDQLVVVTLATVEHDGTAKSHAAPVPHRPIGEIATEKSLAALAGFPNSPLLSDQRFLAGFATNEDVHAWSTRMDMMEMISKLGRKMADKNPMMKGRPMPDYSGRMSQMPRPPVLTTFNFDNGRIILKTTMMYKPEDAAVFKKIYDRGINKDLLARVPNNGLLLGFVGFHLNPAGIPDILDKYHTRAMIDSMLGKKGLTINDISAVIGGDFLVAALADTAAATDTAKKKINFYVVATLGDPAKLMTIAAKAAGGGGTMDTAGMAKMKKLMEKLVIQDNLLVVSTTHELALQYVNNHDHRSTALAGEDNNPMHVAIDLKAVSAYLSHSGTSDPKLLVFARVLEKLEKIDFTGGVTDDTNYTLTFQIVTGDPSTNSLATLLNLMH